MTTALVSLRCPVCRAELSDPVWRCSECDTPAHVECHAEIGGCARFGCVEAATPRRRLFRVLARSKHVSAAVAALGIPLSLAAMYFAFDFLNGVMLLVGCTGFSLSQLREAYRLSRGEVTLAELQTWFTELRTEHEQVARRIAASPAPDPGQARFRTRLAAAFFLVIALLGQSLLLTLLALLAAWSIHVLSRDQYLAHANPGSLVITAETAWMIDTWGPELEELVKDPELAKLTASSYQKGKAPPPALPE